MKKISTLFAIILTLTLSASVSVANHKHGKHNHKHHHHKHLSPKQICEHAVGGSLQGSVGFSCGEATAAFEGVCLPTTSELAPENGLLCAAAGGIMDSVCNGVLDQEAVSKITKALCEPHHHKHHRKHPHHKKHHKHYK